MKNYFSHREVSNKKTTDNHKRRLLTSGEKRMIEKKKVELRKQYPNENDGFLESMLIAYLTDSTMMGTVFGGNITGALIGDMLNDSDNKVEFGGGEFGGAGAGGSWEVNENSTVDNQSQNHDTITDNFIFTESNDAENFS
jgi:hypothetical protein